eukprot:Nitzschia sp. Nitz4//scaffold166_size90379//86989//88209//NITZ4_005074-RA/size90379-exonerate_est2genome-gene-0.77-mRNA-1//1//CDS//3329538247//2083//frame0
MISRRLSRMSPRVHKQQPSLSQQLLQPDLLVARFRRYWTLLSPRSKLLWIILGVGCLFHVVVALAWNSFSKVEPPVSSETSFAVVINTFRRPDRLKLAVQHYAQTCGRPTGISQVFVVWADPASALPTPESLLENTQSSFRFSSSVKDRQSDVQILPKERDSLNSRFEPISQLQSTAIFMVDDDIRVDCASLNSAFQAFLVHPDSMVGFYPRLASAPILQASSSWDSSSATSADLVYHAWPVVFARHQFNLVLTKASFLHSKYLDIYTNDLSFPRAILEHVDQHKNCEDIAMSLLVANYTRYQASLSQNSAVSQPATPIYVPGSVQDGGLFGGISTGTGHMATRSECLTALTEILQKQGYPSPLETIFPLSGSSVWRPWISIFGWGWPMILPSNFFEWFALANTFQ